MIQDLGAVDLNACRVVAKLPVICRLIATMCLWGMIGCGGEAEFKPQLGLVKGTVTINGAPAPDLIVTFEPQSKGGTKGSMVGGASTATTDAQGNFELQYATGGSKGAVVGQHVVRIESATGGGPAGGEKAVAAIAIPAKYNIETTLKADVAAGENPPQKFELEIPKK